MDDYIYGPFHSRRLGMSLGINLLGEKKKCTFNCVYCEIGQSLADEIVDVSYRYDPSVNFKAFSREVESPLRNLPEIDSATFGYMGETTLAQHLAEFLDNVKKIKSSINRNDGGPRISIFTNSTTLEDESILDTLAKFDLVMAKLDCALESHFLKINRPHSSVPRVSGIIKNLVRLRERMEVIEGNQIAIQTLLFRSNNPRIPSNIETENLEALVNAYNRILPDLVQIYTVARKPAERGIYAISSREKEHLRHYFSEKVDKRVTIVVY
ncbi:MAG: radical SAM protein [Promethearchaeota archaeon]